MSDTSLKNLKSSLDRFIATISVLLIILPPHLKSSLDRFIVTCVKSQFFVHFYLKSSLDRFIATVEKIVYSQFSI